MGDTTLDHKQMKKLYLELASFENRGVTIWLEGYPSNPENVADELSLNEDGSYMRDYIFDEGVLKEVHFDKITKNR